MRFVLLYAAIAIVCACSIYGQNNPWTVGARVNVLTGSGEPSNDMIGSGIFVRREFSSRWALMAAADKAEYDFERPWLVLGLEQDASVETIDSSVDATAISVVIERRFGPVGPTRWFAGLGAGTASVDVADVHGPLADGGTFDITTDGGSELLAIFEIGVQRDLGSLFSFEFVLRADHHFADWEVHDRVSGRTGAIDDYTGLGAHLGLGFRF